MSYPGRVRTCVRLMALPAYIRERAGRQTYWKPAQVAAAAATKDKHQRLRDAAYARGRVEYDELVQQPTFREVRDCVSM